MNFINVQPIFSLQQDFASSYHHFALGLFYRVEFRTFLVLKGSIFLLDVFPWKVFGDIKTENVVRGLRKKKMINVLGFRNLTGGGFHHQRHQNEILYFMSWLINVLFDFPWFLLH